MTDARTVGRFAALDQVRTNIAVPTTDNDSFESPMLKQYALIALRWRRTVIGIMLGAILAGVIITFLMTPQYTATALLDIARDNNRVAPVQGVEREVSDTDLEFYQTQYGLLQSQDLAGRVAEELKLVDDPSFFKKFGQRPAGVPAAVDASLPLPAASRNDRKQQAVAILLKYIDVSPVRLSRLVNISFRSSDPLLSMRVANAWVSNFVAQTLERRYDATSYARDFLESRLGQLRERLEESERKLVDYASREKIVDIPSTPTGSGSTAATSRSITAENLAMLNVQLTDAKADRIKAEARLGRAGNGASPEALGNTAIGGIRQKRAELAADYQRMMVQFEPNYPAAVALKAQIDQLDRSLATEDARVNSSLRNEYSAAVTREAELNKSVESLKNATLDLRRRSIQYGIYQREADTNRELYNALLQRYKEIGVASGVGVNNISIVDKAELPTRPSSPKLYLNLILAVLAGMAFSAAVVFILEQSSESLDNPEDVARLLRVPLLGSVPKTSHETAMDAIRDRKSHLVESYFSIETALRFSTDHGVPRSLSVTSSRAGEGKSTTSMALAVLLARAGKKVVLVDGDMRSPSVHELLGLRNVVGFSNFLSGDDQLDQMLQPVNEFGMVAMAAGPNPPNAAELLGSDRLEALLKRLGDRFDHVIIDSPPVMGLADSPLIGYRVEGVIFTIESHGTRAGMVRVALSRLLDTNVRLLGAVLTKFEQKRAHMGYGYGGEYGYGDGVDNKPE